MNPFKIYAILAIIALVIGSASSAVYFFTEMGAAQATVEYQEMELDSRDQVIQAYGRGWASANDDLTELNIELKSAKEGKNLAAEKASRHDYKKLAKRRPDKWLAIANRNGKRLREELKSAANGSGAGAADTETSSP